jgi:hypothetical protein
MPLTGQFTATFNDHNEVVAHGVKIENLEESWKRVESKLDRLLWGMLIAMASSAATLLVLVIKK